jgi:glycine C-acetyltransferase
LNQPFLDRLARQCDELRTAGLYKPERVLASPQQPIVRLADGRELINLCANNYLGLANHPSIREAAHRAIDRYGYGMASVRFICGTQGVHKELETRLSAFLGMDDTILYSSCFDANGGLFETLLDEQDAVISDALNHASIIDGIRLCKARRLRYANDDMSELEARLEEARDARVKLIATDGVFSMDGVVARLREICDIAERHGALVMVDDSHATGFVGHGGRGTPEFREVMGRIDILTGTLGKALGGAAGGYTAARREIVAWLRQRSRPYLFSNSIPPVIAATTLRVLDLVESSDDLRAQLRRNTSHFRRRMTEAGFDIVPGEHPIAPVMLGDAGLAARFAERLLERGVYVIGFSYPVVPMGKARIRTQMCAGHSIGQLDTAIDAFIAVGHELEVLKPGNRGETGA